jgi:3-oxoacyl-[acyl-carrier protein] reductase
MVASVRIARRLARDGWQVVLTSRDEALLAEVAAACRIAHDPHGSPRARKSAVVGRPRPRSLWPPQRRRRQRRCHQARRIETLSDADWLDGYALKLFGAVRLTRAAWPHLRTTTSGSVINIAGIGGKTPGAEFTIGGSVNAALLSFTKALADQGIADGIQVNAINPGPVRTARLQKRLESISEADFVRQERITRIGEPEEVAALTAFMLSPEGRWMHGSLVDSTAEARNAL